MTNEGRFKVYLWHFTVANMQWPESIHNVTPFVKYVAQIIFIRTKNEISTWRKCWTFEWIIHLLIKVTCKIEYLKVCILLIFYCYILYDIPSICVKNKKIIQESWDQNVGSRFCKCHIHHNSAKINYKLVTLHMIRVLLPILFETWETYCSNYDVWEINLSKK